MFHSASGLLGSFSLWPLMGHCFIATARGHGSDINGVGINAYPKRQNRMVNVRLLPGDLKIPDLVDTNFWTRIFGR